jgi:hypothetical protein
MILVGVMIDGGFWAVGLVRKSESFAFALKKGSGPPKKAGPTIPDLNEAQIQLPAELDHSSWTV